jgi:hypothetical protein
MCGSKYVQEVRHTLAILLGTDKSRKLFADNEMARIKSLSFDCDPMFEQLTDALQRKKIPLKESYSKTADFPILADRLERLQRFVDGQQPSQLKGLWRDDRDLMRWYTLWAVIGLGLFAGVLALVQVGIGIIQTVIAWKSYQLQAPSSPLPSSM